MANGTTTLPRESTKRCTRSDCDKPHRAKGYCSTHYRLLVNPDRRVQVPCAQCGTMVDKGATKRFANRFCDYACRDVWRAWQGPLSCVVPDAHPSRSSRVPITHPSRRPLPAISGSCRVFLPDCAVCGLVFASPYTVSTCSPACAEVKRVDDKREQRHKRRAVKRGAFVAPVSRRAIYERDRYRCHLCKRKALMDKPVPHPRAAVLDHVIPLAVGGTHEPANVRTACFMCNCLKGAGGGGEQLMLIG